MDGCRCYKFKAFGHRNIRATHRSTLEVTVEESLTPRGDCIVGVKAPHGASGIPEGVKDALRRGWRACLVIVAHGVSDVVCGWGDERLMLSNEGRMIFRKSSYIDPATVFINADKSAGDLQRRLIGELSMGGEVVFILTAYPPGE
ncbi:MAG: DUF371 domain-containing protein [Desulfurococcales archaeon]|nr:DUF371 domain-containing protein [Desulfurococcales archaeon]